MGLQDPDPGPVLVPQAPQAPQAQVWSGFLLSAVAHVEDGQVVALPRRHAAVAGNAVVPAAAVPLAGVDLEDPDQAPVQDEGPGLVVLVASADQEEVAKLNGAVAAAAAAGGGRTCRPG